METNIIWHYTTEAHAMDILRDRVIKVSQYDRRSGIKPAVWFSRQQYWEPTACKMFDAVTNDWLGGQKGMKIQHQYAGIYRFGIRFDPRMLCSWAKYVRSSKMPYEEIRYMEECGRERGGDPSDWFASLTNVRSNYWVAVEKFNGKQYVPVEVPFGMHPYLSNVA